MKGIIFNLVEGFVVAEGGERAWDGLLAEADLEGGYSSLGDYADEELFALIAAYSETHDVSHRHTCDMLLTLNDVIHPEVRKLHPASRPPDFVYTSTDPDDFVAEPPCLSKLPNGSISPLTPPGHLGRHWP